MKRRGKVSKHGESRPWVSGPAAWIKKTEFPAIAERAARYMQKGGASVDEMRAVYQIVSSAGAFSDLFWDANKLANSRRPQIEALNRIIAGREVDDSERSAVRQLNEELMPQFPKAAIRYREIAKRLSTPKREVKERRVRYIIEDPHRAEKKRNLHRTVRGK